MKNRQLRVMTKKARYTMDASDEAAILRTLQRLPKPIKSSPYPKYAIVAAAIIAFMFFAMPPIVKAVNLLIDRIVQRRIEIYEEYQAAPDAEKLARLVEIQERRVLINEIEGVDAKFMGVVLKPTLLQVCPDAENDDPNLDCWIRLSVDYTGYITYDPYWAQFFLNIGGATYPADQNTKTDFDGDRNDQFWVEDSIREGGFTTLEHNFTVKSWDFEKDVEMTLMGTIDGERFEMSWTFDYEQAHQRSVKEATERLLYEEQYAAQSLEALKQYEKDAATVNLSAALSEIEYHIAEIAFLDNRFHIMSSISGITGPTLSDALETCYINNLTIDGNSVDYLWRDNIEIRDGETMYEMDSFEAFSIQKGIENGYASFITHVILDSLIESLPEESLFCVEIWHMPYAEEEEIPWEETRPPRLPRDTAYLTFKFNRQTKTVTVPANEAEKAAWIEQAKG